MDLALHQKFMKLALLEAEKAQQEDEVPVGCIIVKDSKIIAQSFNLREQTNNPVAHAELLAIQHASVALNNWRLIDTQLYVTLEPCLMCAGAIILARIPTVFFGAYDPKAGAYSSITNAFELPVNHKVEVIPGILQEECGSILTHFFRQKRSKEKKKTNSS